MELMELLEGTKVASSVGAQHSGFNPASQEQLDFEDDTTDHAASELPSEPPAVDQHAAVTATAVAAVLPAPKAKVAPREAHHTRQQQQQQQKPKRTPLAPSKKAAKPPANRHVSP
eukprot:gene5110-5350_t